MDEEFDDPQDSSSSIEFSQPSVDGGGEEVQEDVIKRDVLELLDDPHFNPVTFINVLLPSEQSLFTIKETKRRLKSHINRLENQIQDNLRLLSKTADNSKMELKMANFEIKELLQNISSMRVQARDSEIMVEEICKGIKDLDKAKRNISSTIATQKRLNMFVSAVDQLNEWADTKQYRDVGNLLEAVNQLANYFSSFTDIERLVQKTREFDGIRNRLRLQVYEEFKKLDKPGVVPTQQLADVCVVISALGKKERIEFIKWISSRRIQEYRAMMTAGDDTGKLENMERRYMWAKRELKFFEDHYNSIYPPSWRVPVCVMEEFAQATITDLKNILKHGRPMVNVLIHSLKETLKFEVELVEYFSKQAQTIKLEDSDEEEVVDDIGEEQDFDSRWEAFKRQKEKERLKVERLEKKAREPVEKFSRIISCTFDPYLGIYIDQEDKLMNEKIDQLLREEKWRLEDGAKTKILDSGASFISYMKKSIKRCFSLTKNQPAFDMLTVLRKNIHGYLSRVSAKVSMITQDRSLRPGVAREQTLSLVVNTAGHFSNICRQLVGMFATNIDPQFKDKLSMSNEEQECTKLISLGIKAMIVLLHLKMDSAFQAMSKVNWAVLSELDDQNEYVNELTALISQSFPVFNDWISNNGHFQYLCDKFVEEFTSRFIDQVINRCGRISEIAAPRLLLDFTALKSLLFKIPEMTAEAKPKTITDKFKKDTEKNTAKAEKLIKVLLAPREAIVDTYLMFSSDQFDIDLSVILDVKGIIEKKYFVDELHRKATKNRK